MKILPWKKSSTWVLDNTDPAIKALRLTIGKLVSERSKWEVEAKNHYHSQRACQQHVSDLTIQIERLTNVIGELERNNGTSDQ